MRLCTFSFVPFRTADELMYVTISVMMTVTVITVSITPRVSLAYRELDVGKDRRNELMAV
jgi:hypothetical protein